MGTSTLQSLATEMSKAFETKTRPNGDSFVTLKDGSPAWMTDVVRAAHENGKQLPDDYRYKFVQESVDILAETTPFDEDVMFEAAQFLEPDIYYGQLAAWLGSHASRFGYLDEVLADGEAHNGKDSCTCIQMAQLREKEEVYHAVCSALRDVDLDVAA